MNEIQILFAGVIVVALLGIVREAFIPAPTSRNEGVPSISVDPDHFQDR